MTFTEIEGFGFHKRKTQGTGSTMKTWKEHAKTLVAGVLVAGVVAAGVNLADAATFFTGTASAASSAVTANAINTNNREEVRTCLLYTSPSPRDRG